MLSTGKQAFLTMGPGAFPGGPMVRLHLPISGGTDWIPSQGAKIQHASEPKNQNIKQKQYCIFPTQGSNPGLLIIGGFFMV